MVPLVHSGLSRAQREAVIRPGTPPSARELSVLDGPLSHLLARRQEAKLAWMDAEIRLGEFLAATEWIINKASGKEVPPESLLPEGVHACLREIEARAAEKSKPANLGMVQRWTRISGTASG